MELSGWKVFRGFCTGSVTLGAVASRDIKSREHELRRGANASTCSTHAGTSPESSKAHASVADKY
jgi:hypothetical protein